MKAKVIYNGSPRIEQEINNFLSRHPGLDIKFITQSESDGAEGYAVTVIIWYDDSSII